MYKLWFVCGEMSEEDYSVECKKDIGVYMESLAVTSYIILIIMTCIAVCLGLMASKQIREDNNCDDESYKKLKMYLKFMIGTYAIMFFGTIILFVYVYFVR